LNSSIRPADLDLPRLSVFAFFFFFVVFFLFFLSSSRRHRRRWPRTT
jgi:hypothetical protein